MPTTVDMEHEAARGGSNRLLIGGIVVVVLIAIGVAAALILSNAGSGSAPPPTSVADLVPTPFTRASTISQDVYTITIPDVWRPALADFNDNSDRNRLNHVWEANDKSVYVTLAIVESNMTLAEYDAEYYANEPYLSLIDEATAPDGTLRRSYRVTDHPDGFGNGQVDVFYMERSQELAILELYTADSVAKDSTLLDRFQLILDSVRIVPDQG